MGRRAETLAVGPTPQVFPGLACGEGSLPWGWPCPGPLGSWLCRSAKGDSFAPRGHASDRLAGGCGRQAANDGKKGTCGAEQNVRGDRWGRSLSEPAGREPPPWKLCLSTRMRRRRRPHSYAPPARRAWHGDPGTRPGRPARGGSRGHRRRLPGLCSRVTAAPPGTPWGLALAATAWCRTHCAHPRFRQASRDWTQVAVTGVRMRVQTPTGPPRPPTAG